MIKKLEKLEKFKKEENFTKEEKQNKPIIKELKNIKQVGIFLRPNSKDIKKSFDLVEQCFKEVDIKVVLEDTCAKMIGLDGASFDEVCIKSDFLISLGGDGTLISLARRSFSSSKPILGINLGNLGFLTNLNIQELRSFISELLKGEFKIEERIILEGQNNTRHFYAFNDIVLRSKSARDMVTIDASIDNKLFNTYNGDGLIISTPTGSTAYNLSLGGPIVYPLTDVLVLAPICAHSLTQRPLVLPLDFELNFRINDENGARLIIDGQDIYELSNGEDISIKDSKFKAKLLYTKTKNYFQVLSEKLNWGN